MSGAQYKAMKLDALVVNNDEAESESVRSWKFEYDSLNWGRSAQPLGFDANSEVTEKDHYRKRGIYLHWVLPRELRSKEEDQEDFPLIPNRYLIVRNVEDKPAYSKAWVLESDCPASKKMSKRDLLKLAANMTELPITDAMRRFWSVSSDEIRKEYMVNHKRAGNILDTVRLGMAFDAQSWSERDEKGMFLTALSPGNPAFTAYVPHNRNILSFYDSLEYTNPKNQEMQKLDKETISYMVAGWFSDASVDSSYYVGSVYKVPWDRYGEMPRQDELSRLDGGKVMVSIGENTVDAYMSMLKYKLRQADPTGELARSLTALQYDLLQRMDEPDSEIRLREAVFKDYFEQAEGGICWTLVNREGVTDEKEPWEEALIDELNCKQREYEKQRGILKSLQWELNAAWWKNRRKKAEGKEPDITKEEFDCLAEQVLNQLKAVNELRAKLPFHEMDQAVRNGLTRDTGDGRQEKWNKGIERFARKKGISGKRILKPIETGRYYKKKNPVIAISGLYPPADMDAAQDIRSRRGEDLIKSCPSIGIQEDKEGRQLKQLGLLDGIPEAARHALQEHLVLAAARGKAYTMPKEPPEYYDEEWEQPFRPLFMDWKVETAHIPFETGVYGNWSFDGSAYQLNKEAKLAGQGKTKEFKGISMLSPHITYVLKERIQELLKQVKEVEKTRIEGIGQIIQNMEKWPVLTQELNFFDEMLTQRDGRIFVKPADEKWKPEQWEQPVLLSYLMGYDNRGCIAGYENPEEILGHIDTVPFIQEGEISPLYGSRSGQMYLTGLSVYDKFGRELRIISSDRGSAEAHSKNFPLIYPEHLAEQKRFFPMQSAVIQFSPSIIPYLRLNTEIVKPVCGFIMANHLNGSLTLYDEEGRQAGSLMLMAAGDGERRVRYIPPLQFPEMTAGQLRERMEYLGTFAKRWERKGEREFLDYIRVIDRTLWTTDPQGERSDVNMSVLIGRPLMLLRVRFRLETDGPILKSVSKIAKNMEEKIEIKKTKFKLRMGDRALKDDGVIGHYERPDMEEFKQEEEFLSLELGESIETILLLDPRGSIHIYSGILPVQTITIPENIRRPAFAGMETSFTMGSVLTATGFREITESGVLEETVYLPPMAEQNGDFYWYEKVWEEGKEAYRKYGLSPLTPGTWLDSDRISIREGILQFEADLREREEDEDGR